MAQLRIGSLLFPGLDQIDLTGPFEIFSRISDSTYCVVAKNIQPVEDVRGLILTPNVTFADSPLLDVLHVPGGPGQQDIMTDDETLEFIRRHAKAAQITFAVCTGVLLCGAAGLLRGRRATTHWASLHLLPYFGAEISNERVVVDGNLVTTAGVTAGIDGALQVASILRGEKEASEIQLYMQYAPEPPFNSGKPEDADKAVLDSVRAKMERLTQSRLETAQQYAKGIEL